MSQPEPASRAHGRASGRVLQSDADDGFSVRVPRSTAPSGHSDPRGPLPRRDSRAPTSSMEQSVLPPIFPTHGQRVRAPSLPGVKELLSSSMTLQSQAYPPAQPLQTSLDVMFVGIGLEKYSLSDRPGRGGPKAGEGVPPSPSAAYASGPTLSPISTSSAWSRSRGPREPVAEPHSRSAVEARAQSWPAYDSYQGRATSPTSVDPYSTPPRCSWNARLQGVQVIPGFGDYFVYNDGSRIPTQVDGQMVNPEWGLTKQQKARKRLPRACTRCHKKKQRCEPLEGGCAQCRKVDKACDL